MEQGIVLFFDPLKGFGKIRHSVKGEIFIHINDLREQIYSGDMVSFRIVEATDGSFRAVEVKKTIRNGKANKF
jgi:cold shock CspA family protein